MSYRSPSCFSLIALFACCLLSPFFAFADQASYKVFQDEYIVLLPSDYTEADVQADGITSAQATTIEEKTLRDGRRVSLYRKERSGDVAADLPPAGTVVPFNADQARSFCEELAQNVPFELCEPNAPVEINALPDDALYESLYGMDKIQGPRAWDLSTGSKDVIVAVLDTGVDYSHPDLASNMWINTEEIAGNGKDDDGNGYIDDVYGYDFFNNDGDPFDDNGHGTHVAGTVGAVGDNDRGVVGVNWNVRIMALKFLSGSGGGSTLDAVTAIDFALGHGLDVINASFGGTFPSAALEQAIRRARDAGVLFVAAAGNSAKDTDSVAHYPSGYDIDNIISVAATDQNDNLAFFSNYGATTVDLAAPGVSILSTLPGNQYGNLSGTSMAAPHVAGLAGLLKAYKPELDYIGLKNTLMQSVDRLASLSGVVSTAGRINAYQALTGEVSETPPSTPEGVTIEGFGHRASGKVLFKRRNFRMAFRGEPGEQFNVQLELKGIFDGTCNLGTYEIPSTGLLNLRSKFSLRGWMWYTTSAILRTNGDSLSRAVRRRKSDRRVRRGNFTRRRAEALARRANAANIGSQYAELSCQSISGSLRKINKR